MQRSKSVGLLVARPDCSMISYPLRTRYWVDDDFIDLSLSKLNSNDSTIYWSVKSRRKLQARRLEQPLQSLSYSGCCAKRPVAWFSMPEFSLQLHCFWYPEQTCQFCWPASQTGQPFPPSGVSSQYYQSWHPWGQWASCSGLLSYRPPGWSYRSSRLRASGTTRFL